MCVIDIRWWWTQDECSSLVFTTSAGHLVTMTVQSFTSIQATRSCVTTASVYATSTHRWTVVVNVWTMSWRRLVVFLSFVEGLVGSLTPCCAAVHRRIGAQSTLGGGGKTFLPAKLCMKKNNKMSKFYVMFARKIIKMPEFLWYLPAKLCMKKYPN